MIVELDPDEYPAAIPELAALVVDAVEGGAAVNFLAGVTIDEAAAWWTARMTDVADRTTTVFVARDARSPMDVARHGLLVPTILIRSRTRTLTNRPDRKVLVHRSARPARSTLLMAAAATPRPDRGRWLLIPTRDGSDADAFYPLARLAGARDERTTPTAAHPGPDNVLLKTSGVVSTE